MSPFLSLCMIVRNEEKVLRRCLDSVKDGVDEIVIVDTGSTDNTKKIACEYTDKVFDYEWINNFSEARNYAQSKTSGEWILVLDADEYVYLENLKETVNQLKKNDGHYDAYDVKIFSFIGINGQFTTQHWHTRIYKNDPSIKYYRTIHEQLQKNNEQLSAGLSELILYHSGYLANAIDEKDKHIRNKGLIDKEVEKSGLTGFDYFNLGNEYSSMGKPEKGLYYYKKAYQNKPDFAYSWVSHCLLQMVNCLVNLNRYQDALNVINDANKIYSQSPDFKSMKARIYIFQGRMEDAKYELLELISNSESYQQIISSPDHLYYYPYKWMGIICEKKNKLEKAIFYYSKALNYNSNDDDLTRRYFALLLQHLSIDETYQFIKNENVLNSEVSAVRLMRVLINLPGAIKIVEKLSYLDIYEDKKGIKIKLLWLNNQIDEAFNQLNKLSVKQLLMIIGEGLFDFLDFILLCVASDAQKLLVSFAEVNEKSADIIHFLLGDNGQKKIEPSTYIALLKRTICLQQFDLFEQLLNHRIHLDKGINIQIGHLLYSHHFYDLAVSFYQESGTPYFDQRTYSNLIEECKRRNMEQEAFNFAIHAIEANYYNFTILEDVAILAHKMGAEDLLASVQQLALKCYPDSHYLSEHTIWGEKKKQIALVYSPFSGSNIVALERNIPEEIASKYQINLINESDDLNYFSQLIESDAVVITEGNYPFTKNEIDKDQKVVELWHGFPLKAMGLTDNSESKSNKEEIRNKWENTDCIISYSKMFNQLMKKCVGVKDDKFRITGVPRNDLLLNSDGRRNLSKLFKTNVYKNKFVFYMPTWRNSKVGERVDGNKSWNGIFEFPDFDLEKLDNFLSENQLKLIVKLHPAEKDNIDNSLKQSPNILFLTDDELHKNGMDVYEVLNGADVLITDYSSVYFDFLLLDRPIVFTPTDIDIYSQQRGLILQPYEKWTPGPKVLTQKELCHELIKSISEPWYYGEERNKIKNIVHEYQDDHSSNRTWTCIDQLLN